MWQLVVIIVVIIALYLAAKAVIPTIAVFVLYCSQNLLTGADQILGAWSCVPPWISWAVVMALFAGLLHFALIEARRFSRPTFSSIGVIAALAILVASAMVGPTTNRTTAEKFINRVTRKMHLHHALPEKKELKNTVTGPLTCGVYIIDSLNRNTSHIIGNCFEVRSPSIAVAQTGAEGNISAKKSKIRIVFAVLSCYSDSSGSHTDSLYDTLLLLVKNGTLVSKASRWSLWKGGTTIFDFADKKGEWAAIRPGQSGRNFFCSPNGALSWNEKPLSNSMRPDEMWKISPLSPSGRYHIVMKYDYDWGGSDVNIVDLRTSRVVFRWKRGIYGMQVHCIWSPDERYVLFGDAGETGSDIFCCDIAARTIRKVPIRSLVQFRGDTAVEMQFTDLDTTIWNSSQTFTSKIDIRCNYYELEVCEKLQSPLRTYPISVDAATLAVSYSTPQFFDSIPSLPKPERVFQLPSQCRELPRSHLAAVLDQDVSFTGNVQNMNQKTINLFVFSIYNLDPATGIFLGTMNWTESGQVHPVQGIAEDTLISFSETETDHDGTPALGRRYLLDSLSCTQWQGRLTMEDNTDNQLMTMSTRPFFERLLQKFVGSEWRLTDLNDMNSKMDASVPYCRDSCAFWGWGDFDGDSSIDIAVAGCKKNSPDSAALFVFFEIPSNQPVVLREEYRPFRIVGPGHIVSDSGESVELEYNAIESHACGQFCQLIFWEGMDKRTITLTLTE